MKTRLLLAFLLVLLATLAHASTPTTVTGHVQKPSGVAATNTKVRFELMYCGGNEGRISGTSSIISFIPFDVQADATGLFTTPLWGNDLISCGTTTGSSRWRITHLTNGVAGPSYIYQIQGATLDLDSGIVPCTTTPLVVTNCISDTRPVLPPPPPTAAGPFGGGYSSRFIDAHGFSGATTVNSSIASQVGTNFAAGSGTGGFVAATATELAGFNLEETAGATDQAALNDVNAEITLGTLEDYLVRVQLTAITGGRMWIGISSVFNNSNNYLDDDAPNFAMVAFRFTSGTDTHWMAVTQTSGAPGNPNQTVVDTGVTPSLTASHEFEIVPSSGSILFYIDGAKVATSSTFVPATSLPMRGILEIDRQTNSVQVSATIEYLWWLNSTH